MNEFECQGKVEPFETQQCFDQLLVVTTRGKGDVECFSSGHWRNAPYQPGTMGMTPSGQTNMLRVRPNGPQVQQMLQIHIPTRFFSGARDEYRRAGSVYRKQSLNALAFVDPVVSRIALSLKGAATTGAPDLYAESAATFLAAYLVSLQSGWTDPTQDLRRPGTLEDRRLAHVLEYMNAHFGEPLSLTQLADQAKISPFHFVRVFKESCGVTPHRHLVRIRMEASASMLANTDLPVAEIAFACGYQNAAHFAAAFQKHFSKSPSMCR